MSPQCWAFNVKGPHALLRAALPTLNANADGGAMVLTSSIAVRRGAARAPSSRVFPPVRLCNRGTLCPFA